MQPNCVKSAEAGELTSESVQSAALPLEGVHYVHSSDGLPLGMLGVSDGVTDDTLQEHLEHTTGLFVDEARDALHSTTASQSADGGLGDTLNIVTQHFAMTLGAPFAEPFAALAPSCHGELLCRRRRSTKRCLATAISAPYIAYADAHQPVTHNRPCTFITVARQRALGERELN